MGDDIRTLIEPEPQPEPVKRISTASIISFIAGIGTYVWFFSMIGSKWLLTLIVAPIIALIAILSGLRAKRQIRQSTGVVTGKRLANFGLALGYIYIIVGILILVLVLLGVGGIISGLSGLVGG